MNGAGNADSEDRITPLSGADSIFSYTTAYGTSALKYDSGIYKLVYFAFPFEAIHGAGSFASRDTVMYRVLYWLDPSIVGVEEKANYQLPITNFQLFQNSPNPFHHSTTIRYTLPGVRDQGSGFSGTIRVKLAIYDITGRLVETLVDERQKPGVYQVEWDGRIGVSPVPSGIYFYRLTIGGLDSSSPNTTTKKLILLR